MGLFSKLIGKKKKSRILSDEDIVNAGACPNCWGVQEYEISKAKKHLYNSLLKRM